MLEQFQDITSDWSIRGFNIVSDPPWNDHDFVGSDQQIPKLSLDIKYAML